MPLHGEQVQVHVARGRAILVTVADPGTCLLSKGGCGALLWWAWTATGAKMPLDRFPDAAGIYTAHFATCPQRASFKRPARRPHRKPQEPVPGRR